MKATPFLWLLVSALPISAFAQKGVLLYKDAPWTTDQFVETTPYKDLAKFSTVYNIEPLAGTKIRVNRPLVVKDITFVSPADLRNITEEYQAKAVESVIADWSATIKRYPTSSKHLKPRIAQLQAEIAPYRAGKVKSEGVWMTRDAFIAKRKKAEEERRNYLARIKDEAERMGMIAEQWASLDDAERERIRNAKALADEAKWKADEQRRIQKVINEQRKLAEERAKLKPVERISTDRWVVPPGLDEHETKEYNEALKVVKEQLRKAKQDIGFGLEAQRLVLKTPDCVYTVRPADLILEAQIATPEDQTRSLVLTLKCTEKRKVIEAFPIDGSESAFVAAVSLPTVAAPDSEKLAEALSTVIKLSGGKNEIATASEP